MEKKKARNHEKQSKSVTEKQTERKNNKRRFKKGKKKMKPAPAKKIVNKIWVEKKVKKSVIGKQTDGRISTNTLKEAE